MVSVFKILPEFAFHYSGMGSFGFLLSPHQNRPPFWFYFCHIGNALVTVDEMRSAEFWQLSGGRYLADFPSV